MRSLLTAATILGLAASPAWAQTGTPTAPTTSPMAAPMAANAQALSQQDQTFLKEAANGKAEVETGRWVQEHGQNPAVRLFGRWMVTDHTMADKMLQRTAAAVGASLPDTLDPEAQSMVDKVQKQRGAALDHTYVQDMVKDHEEDVQKFQQEANSGQNAQVKAFAQEMLPVLQEHLAGAKELEQHAMPKEAHK